MDFQGTGMLCNKIFEFNFQPFISKCLSRGVYLAPADLMNNAALDVPELTRRYPGMCGRCVEGKEVPEDAPNDADAAGGVEDDPPAKVGNEKATERVGDANAKAEP